MDKTAACASLCRRLDGSASGTGKGREEYEYEWQEFWGGCWGPGGCEVCAGGPGDSNPWNLERAGGAVGKEGADVETFMAVVDTMETRLQETQRMVAELGKKLEKSVRDLKKQWDSKVKELKDDLELRVDEIAKSVRDGSKELQVLAHAVKNLKRWVAEVAYKYLRPLQDSVKNLEQCWFLRSAPPAQGGKRMLGAPVRQSTVVAPFSDETPPFLVDSELWNSGAGPSPTIFFVPGNCELGNSGVGLVAPLPGEIPAFASTVNFWSLA